MVDDETGQHLFLEPDAAFAAAQSIGRDTGDALAVQPRTLHRRLAQAGLLVSVDEGRGRLTVRRTLGGTRRNVLHLRLSLFQEPSQPSQSAHQGTDQARPGADPWDVRGVSEERNGPQGAPEPAQDEPESSARGTVGTVGTVAAERDVPHVDGYVRDAEWVDLEPAVPPSEPERPSLWDLP